MNDRLASRLGNLEEFQTSQRQNCLRGLSPFLLPFSWKEASRGRGSNDVDVGNKNQEWQNKSTKANCITTKEPRSSTAFGGCRCSAYCLSTAAAAVAAASSYYSTRLLQSGGRGR